MTTAEINTSLDKLLHDLDNLQIKRRPLQPHITQSLSEPEKILYATVLVTLLTNQDISESQSRLLAMLLDSMGMSNDLQKLYANIPKLDIEQLKIFCELCDKHSLGASFLMDVLTLCRLDKALSEQQSKSLSELISLLGLDETALLTILHLSNKVLGDTMTPSAELSEAKIEELSGLGIDFDYESLKPWHEFGYQVMTKANLIKGITTGDWIVLEEHSIEEDIIIKNASIFFSKNARINIEGYYNEESILIKNVNLINASFNVKGLQLTTIQDSLFLNSNFKIKDFKNLNISNSQFISKDKSSFDYNFISENGQSISIYESKFEFYNSNGLFFYDSQRSLIVKINDSSFIMGSVKKSTEIYYALYFKGDIQYDIEGCEFLADNEYKCFINNKDSKRSKSISNSKFNCSKNEFLKNDITNRNIFYNIFIYRNNSGGGIFVGPDIYFRSCNFENILSYFSGSEVRILFHDSSFVNSTVYNNRTNDENDLFSNCKIKNKDIPVIKNIGYADQ